METELEEKYDVIIQGTGLVECLVAGAAARIGKSVLHLDPNSCYGGQWASFSLNGLQKWVAQQQSGSDVEQEKSSPSTEDERAVRLGVGAPVYSNVTCTWRDREETVSKEASESETTECDAKPTPSGEPAASTALSRDALLSDSRRFNVDLAPKILYSRGEMVELLISSNVARYVEFKCITRLLCWSGDRLRSVPCSRAQVFSSKAVSLLQKRLLMKFLQFAAVYTEQPDRWHDVREKAFSEFLTGERITGDLQKYVMEGMALCSPHATVEEGLRSLHLFLTSLGRYGASPFLATLYGSGELPQAFCRLCAVFGGTYILERSISSVLIGSSTLAADSNSTPTDPNAPASASKTVADETLEKGAHAELAEVSSQSTEGGASNSGEARAVLADTDSGSSGTVVVGVVSDGRHFKCDHLVIEDKFMDSFSSSAAATASISRAVFIVDRDLLQAFTAAEENNPSDDKLAGGDITSSSVSKKEGGVALVQLQGGSGQPVTALQFAPDTCTCAPRTWLLHLVCEGSNAEQDLAPVVQQLVEHYTRCAPAAAVVAPAVPVAPAQKLPDDDSSNSEEPLSSDLPDATDAATAASQVTGSSDAAVDAPVVGDSETSATSGACSTEQSPEQASPIVYSLFYNQVLHSGVGSPYPNLHFSSGPDGALDYDAAIRQARSIFSKMYPGEEFMPRAPDPDEIIFDDPAPIEEEHCSDDLPDASDSSTAEAQPQEDKSSPQNHLENAQEQHTGDQTAIGTEDHQATGVSGQSEPRISESDSEHIGS